MIVYRLTHQFPDPDEDGFDRYFELGLFSARSRAESAVEQLRRKPGFRDYPDGFTIDEMLVDQICWEEGFISDP